MKAERCRKWREEIGAYALGHLSAEESAALEAHLEGCAACSAEAASLTLVSSLLPHADPERFGPAPAPPPELAGRVAAAIGSERRGERRRRALRIGFPITAAAAAAAAALAIFVLPGDNPGGPEQHISFRDVPAGVKIGATLEPRAFGTEIRMYVKGIRSGTLCRVFLRGPRGQDVSAGTFSYRWGGDENAVLASALDLSSVQAIVVHAGSRTFVAPIDSDRAANENPHQEEST
jgi:Putative zinc-finger